MTLEDVKALVAMQLGVAAVDAGDHLVEDLGAESADVVNVVAAVEDRWGVEIGEDELAEIRTVGDLYERARRRLAGEG